MQRSPKRQTLQKFSSVHAQVHNHFNQERHLVAREIDKQRRLAAITRRVARSRGLTARLGLGMLCQR